jgi:hypothetical protein
MWLFGMIIWGGSALEKNTPMQLCLEMKQSGQMSFKGKLELAI